MAKTILPSTWKSIVDKPEIWVSGADPTGVADSTAAFVAAADRAVAAGVDYVKVNSGHYHCPDMTSDEMSGVYIVGDATMTPTTYVWPFRSVGDWYRPPQVSQGRGMIGIELDDGWVSHWEEVFPVMKSLDVPIGYAIPPERPRPWAKEVWRHGHEILGHGDLNWATATDEQRNAAGQANVDMISAITGDTDNIAFVYPFHARNDASDRIAKKYFCRARGVNNPDFHEINYPGSWHVSADDLDNIAAIENRWKHYARVIASTNTKGLFYWHYPGNNPSLDAMKDFILYCRSLGIQIVKPSSVYNGPTPLTRNPSLEEGVGWTQKNRSSWDTTQSWIGNQSWKIDNTGLGNSGTEIEVVQSTYNVIPKTEQFSVLRLSLKYKCDNPLTFASGGLTTGGINIMLDMQIYNDKLETAPGGQLIWGGARIPDVGISSLPAAPDWTEVSKILYFNPIIRLFRLRLRLPNVAPNVIANFDDLRLDLIRHTPVVHFDVTLDGTNPVTIYPCISVMTKTCVVLSPKSVVSGTVSWSLVLGDAMQIQSTDPSDTGVVRVSIFPPNT